MFIQPFTVLFATLLLLFCHSLTCFISFFARKTTQNQLLLKSLKENKRNKQNISRQNTGLNSDLLLP